MHKKVIATGTSGLELSSANTGAGLEIYSLSGTLADGGKFYVSISDPYTERYTVHRSQDGNIKETSKLIPILKECIALHGKGELPKIQMLLNANLSASTAIASGN